MDCNVSAKRWRIVCTSASFVGVSPAISHHDRVMIVTRYGIGAAQRERRDMRHLAMV
jgi:hypothetical protein